MFIADLFEARVQKVVVIMPGGFHPFHTGHLSLYNSALKAFPKADVFVAATNDTKSRPFPYEIKQELAGLAGVPPERFVQVKIPFAAREITDHYDPETTALVFVRSEKDRNEPPQPAKIDPATGKLPLVTRGPRKGQPVSDYLQFFTSVKNLQPMSQHSYIAYLPTVEFAGGITSATEIRTAWANGDAAAHAQIAKTLYPKNPQRAMQLLASALNEGVAEANDRDFVSFMNKSLGDRVDAPKASNTNAPDWYRNAPVHDLDSVKGGWGKALRWGLGVLKRLSPDQKIKLAARGEDGVTDWLTDLAIKKGLAMDYNIPDQDHTQFQFAQEDVTECQDYLADVFHDPNITSWLDVIQQNEGVAEASGVIATKAQAKDPRYSMSLTKDVRPGQIEKNLRAFRL